MVYNRYAYDKEKRVALETWDRLLRAILTEKKSGTVVPTTATRKRRSRASVRRHAQSSIGSKSAFVAPQSGHTQSSGMASKGVPGAIPASGSPSAGS
jgi:hypothetical protein